MYLPERGFIANMLRLSPETDDRPGRLLQSRRGAKAILPVPTVHRLLTRAGVRSTCLIQETLFETGLSVLLHAEATNTVTFESTAELFVTIRKLLETDPDTSGCIWAYWDAMDPIQHKHGARAEESEAEVRSLSYSLQRELLEPLGESNRVDAALMITADHGHVHAEAEDVISVARLRRLQGLLGQPPSGTGRCPYLYARAGEADALAAYVRRALGDRAVVVPSADALADGLWGPGTGSRTGGPEVSGRIGDVVALLTGSRVLFYPYREGLKPSHMVGGRHGGLHEDEMLIPLICSRLSRSRKGGRHTGRKP
jgi:hypothetical protein